MTDLVTLAQAQAFVEDDSADGQQWVQACLDAATDAVIEHLGVDPTSQTRTELLSGFNTSFLIPRAAGKPAPISGVQSIAINPAMSATTGSLAAFGLQSGPAPQLVDMSKIAFDDGKIYYTNGAFFPRGNSNITLVYDSGYKTIPPSIQQATLYTVKAFFTTVGKEMNASGESYAGVMSQSFFPSGPGAVPPAAQLFLAKYQVKVFAG